MQNLILFVGEKESEKNQIFNLIQCQKPEQILFESIKIKQIVNQQQIPELLIINFPQVKDLHNEIAELLTLSKHLRIVQLIICLKFRQGIENEINQIQTKIKQQCKEMILTFYINDSPQEKSKENKINYIRQVNNLKQDQKEKILNQILEPPKVFHCEQSYILKKCNINSVQILEKLFNSFKFFFQDYLTKCINNIENLNNLFQEENSELETYIINIKTQFLQFQHINLSQFYCYLLHLHLFSYHDKEKVLIDAQLKFQLQNLKFCNHCQIIYEIKGKEISQHSQHLFKLNTTKIKYDKVLKCQVCKSKVPQSEMLETILQFIKSLFYVKLIQGFYENNISSFDENQIRNQLQPTIIESQNLILSCQNLENTGEENQNVVNSLQVVFLSNEDDGKTETFSKVYHLENDICKNIFQKGNIIRNQFNLIDTPLFMFDEVDQELESEFSEFFRHNKIHFIFFCIKHQRTSLMKERILSMMKKFSNLNQSQMGIIIFTNLTQNSDKLEIIKSMQNILKQIMIITENDSSEDIIDKIQNCIKDLDFSKTLSFKDTIFNSEEDQQTQDLIQQQLSQITQQVKIKIKTECEKEIFYQQSKLQALEEQQKQLQIRKVDAQEVQQQKRFELEKLIKQYQNELEINQQLWEKENSDLQQQIDDITYKKNQAIQIKQSKQNEIQELDDQQNKIGK